MFVSDCILHAGYCGVLGSSVSYVPIKLKFHQDLALHFSTKTLSDLPNLTLEFLPAGHMFILT